MAMFLIPGMSLFVQGAGERQVTVNSVVAGGLIDESSPDRQRLPSIGRVWLEVPRQAEGRRTGVCLALVSVSNR